MTLTCGTENPLVSRNDLLGTWRLLGRNGVPVDQATGSTGTSFELIFYPDGTYEDVVIVDGERETYLGIWRLTGNELETSGEEGLVQEVTIRIDNNRLTIATIAGDRFEYLRIQ